MNFIGRRNFCAGEVIFNVDEDGNCAYIIDSGRVEIYLETEEGGVTPLAVLGVGEIFGEMAIVDDSARSASARALTDCKLSIVSKGQLSERIISADPIVRLLVTMLMKRIRRNNYSLPRQISSAHSKEVVTEFGEDSQVIEKIKFEKELSQAVEEDELILYYQPIVEMTTEKVVGFEALIRWDSPERGLVRPDLFLGIAEETSLIIPIGDWVFRESCRGLKEIQKETGLDQLFMSINVSGKQFGDPEFFKKITGAIKEFDVNPKNIKLEITETLLAENEFVKGSIEKCREAGFLIAIDDFGTGYSSLSCLSDFSVDNLKIDQSFIKKMRSDNTARIVTDAIMYLTKRLNIPVIAEGIETEEDSQILKAMGCEYGQGYLFARPTTLERAIQLALKKDLKPKVVA